MDFKLTEKGLSNSSGELYEYLRNGLLNEIRISSITGVSEYTILDISEECIQFRSLTRNSGKIEKISKEDFITVTNFLKKDVKFNTSSAKGYFAGTRIYKKTYTYLYTLYL